MDSEPLPPLPPRRARSITVPMGCVAVAALGFFLTFGFMLGNAFTLRSLTNPYIQSSALIKGFFARLSQGAANAQKEKYIHTYLAVAGLSYEEPTGWFLFGKPAAISGRVSNGGDQVIDGINLAVYFVDGTGQIAAGGTIVLPDIIKPSETVPFRVTEKDAGFTFPKNARALNRIYRIEDIHFYEPPKRAN